MAANPFLRFYTFLAKMGLVMLDDPPRVIDMTGREWGEPVDGLALSIRELPREDPNQVAGISVVLKNGGSSPKTLLVPDWIHYFEISGLDLTPYGRRLMDQARAGKKSEFTLGSGDANETELPISRVYDLCAGRDHGIQVSCRLPDGNLLRSNTISVRVQPR